MTRFHSLTALLSGSALLLGGVTAAAPGDRRWRGTPRFHDPSTPVREGSTWYCFSTGNGVSVRTSRDLKRWSEAPPVFKDPPAWHRGIVPNHRGHLWAPDVIRRGDRYLLYYSVSGWGKNTSAIGLASSASLDPADKDYGWRDDGIVIRSTEKSDFNAIDPQLFEDAEKRLWMVFGSFWTGIQLIELDPATGLRHPERRKVRQLAWHTSIEAPALLHHDGYYYLFVNWGRCCRGVESTYEIRIGRSRKITGPYLDAAGEDMATGGGTLLLGTEGDQIGPGHPAFLEVEGGTRMFYHYYDGKRGGFSTLGSKQVGWTGDGWPKLGE